MATGLAMAPAGYGRKNSPVTSISPRISSLAPTAARQTSFLGVATLSSVSAFSGMSVRQVLAVTTPMVRKRATGLIVRAGKASLGCTKRSRSRKSRARAQGFRKRMSTADGRNVLRRRRKKGRKVLVTQSNPNSGKRA